MAYAFPGVDPKDNATLASIEQKTGEMQFFRVLAHSPEILDTFAPFYESVMGPGALGHRIKELVYLAVSYANECEYCRTHHERSAAKTGISQDEMHAVRLEQDHLFNDRERGALVYARELTRTCEGGDREAVRKLFSSRELVELTSVIALANFTNRVNNGLGVELEKK